LALYLADKQVAITNAAHNAITATFQLTEALADGAHTFKAKWLDKFGTWSALGTALTITVDTASPTAPTIGNLVDGQVIIGTSVNVSGTVSLIGRYSLRFNTSRCWAESLNLKKIFF